MAPAANVCGGRAGGRGRHLERGEESAASPSPAAPESASPWAGATIVFMHTSSWPVSTCTRAGRGGDGGVDATHHAGAAEGRGGGARTVTKARGADALSGEAVAA